MVVLLAGIDSIPERMPGRTPGRNLSLTKLSKGMLNSFYATLVSGNVLVTVREAVPAPGVISIPGSSNPPVPTGRRREAPPSVPPCGGVRQNALASSPENGPSLAADEMSLHTGPAVLSLMPSSNFVTPSSHKITRARALSRRLPASWCSTGARTGKDRGNLPARDRPR